MAGTIKGITIQFKGDTTQLDSALRSINNETKGIDSELRKVNTALKFNPTSVELWHQKQTLLKDRIAETKTKLDTLKEAQKKLDDDGSVDKNSADYRNLQREIIETESKLKTYKQQLKEVASAKLTALGEQFKQVGAKMTAIGRTMSMYVTAPIVAMGTAAVKSGASFDTAMSQVAATSGKTVKEINDLRDFAKEMGSTTAFSATQAAEGLNYMALAGYDAKKSMAMLPSVLNLAAAGAMELDKASDMVTDAQTALGLSTKQTAKLIDQMAATSAKSNTSVSQLGAAILKVGPNAKNMAGGTKELNTVLGLLADNGIKGAKAGTNLRNILLSMNTTKVKDAFHELGVEIFDANGNMRDLTKVFPELSKAMDGLTNEERVALLQKLFNKTDLAAVNALLDTSADRWEELGDAIGNSGGAAQKMADTQLDNLQGSLTLLKSALEGAGIAISDVLSPYIRKLADLLSGLVSWFNKLDPGIQKAIVAVLALVAAIGPLLVIAGTLASAIGALLPMLAGISVPVVAAVAAIATLVAGFGTAMATSKDFRKAVGDLVKELGKSLEPIIKEIIKIIGSLIKTITDTAGEIAKELAPVIKTLTPLLKAAATVITGVLMLALKKLKLDIEFVCGVVRVMVTVFTTAFNSIVTLVTSAYKSINKLANDIAKALDFSTMLTTMKTLFTTGFQAVVNTVTGAYNNLKTLGQNIAKALDFSTLINTISTTFTNIKTAITNAITEAKNAVSTLVTQIKSVINFDALVNAVKTTFQNIKDGIKEKLLSAKEAARTIVGQIITVTNFDSLINSVKSTFNSVKASIKDPIVSAKEALKTVVDQIKSVVSFDSLISTVKSTFNSIKDAMSGPIKSAKEKISGIIDTVKGFFPIKLGNIFSGIKLPHFKVSGGKAPWGIGGKGTAPSINIEWYAKGGIFNSPSVIGIGEAGPEAVVPLDKFWRKLEEMNGGGITVNVYGADNMSVTDLAEAVEQKIIQLEKRRREAWQ